LVDKYEQHIILFCLVFCSSVDLFKSVHGHSCFWLLSGVLHG